MGGGRWILMEDRVEVTKRRRKGRKRVMRRNASRRVKGGMRGRSERRERHMNIKKGAQEDR